MDVYEQYGHTVLILFVVVFSPHVRRDNHTHDSHHRTIIYLGLTTRDITTKLGYPNMWYLTGLGKVIDPPFPILGHDAYHVHASVGEHCSMFVPHFISHDCVDIATCYTYIYIYETSHCRVCKAGGITPHNDKCMSPLSCCSDHDRCNNTRWRGWD